jgi:processive 1,2-diacylglycerol beta-glucosyltransferase
MKKRFFLILSASGGAGHIRAAEALHQAAQSSGLPIESELHDCLDFTSAVFKRIYSGSYLAMVNRAPELWGYLYGQAEKKPYSKKGLLKIFDHFNYGGYLRTLRSLRPDALICTHFLPFISISERIRRAGIRAPVFAVTTDFDAHQLWIDPIVSRYYVHHDESAWQLRAKGVSRENIAVKGIPVLREFTRKLPQEAAQQLLGLREKRFTLLVLSGGFGVGRVEQLVRVTAETLGLFRAKSFNLLVVCGKNEKARTNLEKRRFPANIHVRVFGFVTNIHDLMDASDVLISKSGGLTSAESMAKRLPMIIVDPIPGQETRNAEMIVERGAGMLALDLPNLGYKLHRVVEEPSILRRARRATRELAKPHAARDIVADIYSLLERRR